MKHLLSLLLLTALLYGSAFSQGASFEEAVVDVGNIGLTITNSGFFGRANVRNQPTGPPSMEYPLDSGVEHLFEAGLWIGARRSDGTFTVRTGSQTSSRGYQAGALGFELTPNEIITERSTLRDSEALSSLAISHQDYLTSYVDTARVLPNTFIPHPDPAGRLGLRVDQKTLAWNFPFTEAFVIVQFDIENISNAAWDSVYVGIYSDLVVRNVNTTTESGGAFFNKGGHGFLDSLHAVYAFNAGGTEESVNTYGGYAFLGAEWEDPDTGQRRFFHPNVAETYVADGLPAPRTNPRWWNFGGNPDPELSRPGTDIQKYDRMAQPYPNPRNYTLPDGSFDEAAYEEARRNWRETLRTGGQRSEGNYLTLLSAGPFPRVEPGDVLTVTFAFVTALKPEAYQGLEGRPIDNEESQALLRSNLLWAQRTYRGEDNNYNGILDPGEDINENGVLDRFLIPEPPSSPTLRVELEQGKAVLYWARDAEASIDPVTGRRDFEGYRIYRSDPGDDLRGNIANEASLIAQFDKPGNRTGFNNGLDAIALSEPVTFPDDTTRYYYRFESDGLLSGWQYLFAVTAFDEGDPDAGLPSFESSRTANAVRVFPGTPPRPSAEDGKVGVYPNPYRTNAAWDGGTNRTRKLYFYNLPPRAQIRVYTLAGEIVASFDHDAATYTGSTRWYNDFSAENRVLPGGEHAWDLLSDNGLNLATGLYLFTVKNLDTDEVQTGKFVIIR
ncbi:hypothetical protein AWN76_002030 [Rhodothermaceae bacterium RA]|nr:hypothetical protein AWN76_002030 [Rhodothermaceae bacterium RA]